MKTVEKFLENIGFIGIFFILIGVGLYFYNPNAMIWIVRMLIGIGFLIVILGNLFSPVKSAPGFNKKYIKKRLSSLLAILFFIVIIGLIDFIGVKHHYRYDMTKDKHFSLSEQTKKILGNLKYPVKIKCFFQETNEKFKDVKTLIKEYSYQSNEISFDFIDPVSRPDVIEKYAIKRDGTIVFEMNGKREDTFGTSEVDLTSALLKLTSNRGKKIIYLTTSHNELNIDSTDKNYGLNNFKDALEKQNFALKKISLSAIKKIPSDASTILIASPKVPFLKEEINLLNQYLKNNGHLLLLLDPPSEENLRIPDFHELLNPFGIEMKKDFVIDTASFLYPSVGVPIIQSFGWHQITKDFHMGVVLAGARSIEKIGEDIKGINAAKLAETSRQSWGETDLSLKEPVYDKDKDIKGPLMVAVALEKNNKLSDKPNVTDDKKKNIDDKIPPAVKKNNDINDTNKDNNFSRMVIIGDGDIVSNALFGKLGNSDFILNSLSWLCQEEELISIRPKTPDLKPLVISSKAWSRIFIIVFLTPLLVLFLGGFFWWKRR